jgi:peroxiredoxin
MKILFLLLALAFPSVSTVVGAVSQAKIASDFSLQASDGTTQALKEYRGKWVVLEWLNHGCPFVKKHYESGNMQALQEKFTKRGVVWFSVISSAPGKQGFSTPAQANADKEKHKSRASGILLDQDGKVGKLYGAQTTPHFFIVNPKGELFYSGAIDDKPSTELADVKTAKNFVSAALEAGLAGKQPEVSISKAYGCSVKY